MSRGMYPRALALAILAALAIGVAASSAAGVLRSGEKEVQKGNTSCSDLNGSKSLGVAWFAFRAAEQSVQVELRIKHGLINTPYTVILLDADTCTEIVTMGTVRTNRKGKATRTLKADVGASRDFVVDAYDGGGGIHNMSEAAHF